MIVYTMSIEEIQKEINNILYDLKVIGTKYTNRFKKVAKKRLCGKPIFFKRVDSFKLNGNTYLLTYGSRKGTLKDLTWAIFLQIDNVLEGKEYYQILSNGMILKITHHFVKRFIERTQCKSEEFLPCLTKEMSLRGGLALNKEFGFMPTLNGVAVIKNFNTLITYINDLNSYKSEIKEQSIQYMEDFMKKLKDSNISYNKLSSQKCLFKI